MAANDKQIDGDHYKRLGSFQPWDVLQAWLTPEEYRGWQKGAAIVYLARERQKGGDTDIAKAGHHIEKLVETMKDRSIPDMGLIQSALEQAKLLYVEALPKFDWGKSALDAQAIKLLNETPALISKALSSLGSR